MRWFARSGAAALTAVTLMIGGAPAAHAVDPNPGVNDPPDIVLPGPLSTEPGVPVSFAPTVSDLDEHLLDTELEIDISDLDGIGGRSVPAGDYGTFSWGGGTGVTSDVQLAPLTTQNTALATFTYTPAAGFAGTARIVFEIDDQGNVGTGGVLSRTRFIDITVAAPGDPTPSVNDGPDIVLPSSLSTAVDTPISFAPTVSDPDAGPGPTELEIDISDLDGIGGLSVPAGDYGTFSWGAGTGVTSDVLVTPLDAQNTALATFTYTPPAGFTGTARIVFEIDDQGNTGSEFPPVVLSRTRFIDIAVLVPTDLAVTKSSDATSSPGDTIAYALALSNDGAAPATLTTLTDTLPTGTTFVSATQDSGPAFTLTTPAVGDTGEFTASIASLGVGESATFTLVVEVAPDVVDGTVVTNVATADTTTPDSDGSNDSDDASTTVEVDDPGSTTTTTTTTVASADDEGADDNPTAAAGVAAGQQATSTSGTLPVTGVGVGLLLMVAAVLIGGGLMLRSRSGPTRQV
jgi:uncharacterized repeat protein (TIGR01451 family)